MTKSLCEHRLKGEEITDTVLVSSAAVINKMMDILIKEPVSAAAKQRIAAELSFKFCRCLLARDEGAMESMFMTLLADILASFKPSP